MATWNPTQYLKFGNDRLRPSLDLMAQIPLQSASHIVDLGCGPGNVTAQLANRWLDADIIGVDSSVDMLEKAKADYKGITWQQADVANWAPSVAPDLIFSNACLHWVGGHQKLFSHLIECLAPKGVLAVQMPNNFAAATHQAIGDVLGLDHVLCPGFPVHKTTDYYDWLSDKTSHLNIWETTYQHVLSGDNPIADWTKGAALRPVLDGLETDQEKIEFEEAYRDEILKSYPKSKDGKTLMAFKRFFLVAQKL